MQCHSQSELCTSLQDKLKQKSSYWLKFTLCVICLCLTEELSATNKLINKDTTSLYQKSDVTENKVMMLRCWISTASHGKMLPEILWLHSSLLQSLLYHLHVLIKVKHDVQKHTYHVALSLAVHKSVIIWLAAMFIIRPTPTPIYLSNIRITLHTNYAGCGSLIREVSVCNCLS